MEEPSGHNPHNTLVVDTNSKRVGIQYFYPYFTLITVSYSSGWLIDIVV